MAGGLLLVLVAYLTEPYPADAGERLELAKAPREEPPVGGSASVVDGGTTTASEGGPAAEQPVTSLRIAGGGNFLAGLASIEGGAERDAYLDGIIGRLAALGPEAALAQVQQLEDAELRDMAMLALLQELSLIHI